MKNFKFLFILLALGAVFTSCEDTDKAPFSYGPPESVDGRTGVFVTADVTSAFINGDDVPNGSFDFTLRAPSNNVAQFDIYVQRVTPAPDLIETEFLLVETVTSFPSDVNITSQKLADTFGVTIAELNLGDRFNFRNVATGTDGTVVSQNDIDPDLQNEPGQKSAFALNTLIVCPLPAGYASGDYLMSAVGGGSIGGGAFGTIFFEETVTLAESSVFERTFQPYYLPQFNVGQPDSNFTVVFLCNVLNAQDGIAGNLSCGGTGITLNSSTMPTSYDLADDSVFTLNFSESTVGSGCGDAVSEATLVLTKL